MGNGFWLAVGQMCQLCFWTVRYLPRGDWRQLPRRTLMFGLTIPVLIVFQLVHWLGFALDELLFRKYRRVAIRQPIFVTGIPRSGTTHVHRILARHDQLTSMQTWECVLAPSISERYLYRAAGRLLSPIGVWLDKHPLPFVKKMSSIHALGLTEAEEDFIALMPINACFLLVVLFPDVSHYWRLAHFDSEISDSQKKVVLGFYRRMIQKHLYVHGSNLRYLSKNPSFLTWVHSLSEAFPDASFVVCERNAAQTIPSQLSSLQPTWQLFYGNDMPPVFAERIVLMLANYYHYLEKLAASKVVILQCPMTSLTADLASVMADLRLHCDLPCTPKFSQVLQAEIEKSKHYKSVHQYQMGAHFDWQDSKSRFPDSAFSTLTQ